jgi:dTDP-4-amino-4,6-dideoxygalactose transaminase
VKIPFSPPYIDEDIKQEVIDALTSGWITTGPRAQALEELIAGKTGIDRVLCCNSATSGLMLMLNWFGVGKGDEVIIPSYTYAATALVVMHMGATPVMVDVGKDFNMDVNYLKSKISEQTKVIIPVDVGGWPCDYRTIQGLVNSIEVKNMFSPNSENQKKLGRIMVLSDAAHSIGALYEGRPAAHGADFTIFSFHAVKNITTGEGGAICINLPADFDNNLVWRELKLWTMNGQTKDALAKTNGSGWRYDIVYPGFKINMPDICAAIGLAQLRKYQEYILPERRRVFNHYSTALASLPWAELPPTDDEVRQSSCHLFALRIKGITEPTRDKVIEAIEDAGVSVNVHFQPLPMLTVFKDRGYSINDFPVAYDNYSREISLPIYPELDTDKVNYVVRAVTDAYHSIVGTHAQANI